MGLCDPAVPPPGSLIRGSPSSTIQGIALTDPTATKTALEQALPPGSALGVEAVEGGFSRPDDAPDVPLGDDAAAVLHAVGCGDLYDALPEQVRKLATPSLTALDVIPTADGKTDVTLALRWPVTWEPVPGLLTIGEPGLLYTATNTGGAVERSLIVSGVVGLAGVYLDTQVDLIGGSGELDLLHGDEPTTLRPLLELFHAAGSPFDAALLEDLRASFDVPDRSVLLWLRMGGLDLYQGPSARLTLSRIEFEIDYAGGPDGGAELRAAGVLTLTLPRDGGPQDVALQLIAEHPGPGAGWQFAGEVRLTPAVGLAALASAVSARLGGPQFATPVDLEVASLGASFDTHARDLTFHASGDLALGDAVHLPLRLDLASLHQADGSVERRVSGALDLPLGPDTAPLRLQAAFASRDADGARTTILGAAFANEAGVRVGLGDLVGALEPLDDPQRGSLNALSFAIHHIDLALLRGPGPARYAFKADVDGGVDLSALPLVGERLPAGFRVGLELAPCLVRGAFSEAERAAIRSLLPTFGELPPAGGAGTTTVRVALLLGDQRIDFDAARRSAAGIGDTAALVPRRPETAPPPPGPATTPVRPPPQVTWVAVQKRLGPIALQRIGVGFELAAQKITVLLDASLGLAGLELALMGLGASYSVATRALEFHLEGIGLHFDRGSLSMTGTFLRQGPDDYVGEARVQAASWSLGALGAYSKVNGKTSVFLYAFLDAPLGGPPFMFVEGLAFGFGYNRSLTVPPVREIHAFPLVSEVIGDPPAPIAAAADRSQALSARLTGLDAYLRPTVGQHFVAVGLKFSSFKLLRCFALAAVSFGEVFAVDVLGTATLEHPPDSDVKLALVELDFAVRIHPDEGFFAVEAALSRRSFVYTSACHLTGGAAFYAWSKAGPWHGHDVRAGDFVLTVGGYHPDYRVPAHYPRVDPLGLDWALSEHMWLKGGFYFALVPDAVMAGGRLQAHFDAGPLRADFLMGVDFMMKWRPFCFTGAIFIEVAVHLDLGLFDIAGSFGAELAVWGPGPRPGDPQLSGHAAIHLGPIRASVEFGLARAPAPPLAWDAFIAAFVPAAPTGTRVAAGLVRTLPLADADPRSERFVVNPKELAIETHSVIPLTHWRAAGQATQEVGRIHPPPMSTPTAPVSLTSCHTISVTDRDGLDVSARFSLDVVRQGFPSALWGEAGATAALVDGVAGVRLVPANQPAVGSSRPVDRGALGYTVAVVALAADAASTASATPVSPWTKTAGSAATAEPKAPAAPSGDRRARADALAAALIAGAAARRELAAAFALPGERLDAARVAAALTDLPATPEVRHA